MLHSLPLFHRLAGQPVIVLGEGEAAEAKCRLLERSGAVVVDVDNQHARLAFVALDEPEAAAAQLKARGLLVNVVDRPELCDFTTPSLLERGPVLVAVSTGGVSAGLAKALRLRLEGLLPASLGMLAEGLNAARAAMKVRWPDGRERRRVMDTALAAGGALDPLAENRNVAAWLRAADPDDLTLREARWLGSADLVAYEAGVPAAIRNRARADAAQVEVAVGAAAGQEPGLTVVIRRGSTAP